MEFSFLTILRTDIGLMSCCATFRNELRGFSTKDYVTFNALLEFVAVVGLPCLTRSFTELV